MNSCRRKGLVISVAQPHVGCQGTRVGEAHVPEARVTVSRISYMSLHNFSGSLAGRLYKRTTSKAYLLSVNLLSTPRNNFASTSLTPCSARPSLHQPSTIAIGLIFA